MTGDCPGCGIRNRGADKAFCYPCWRRVPKPLQDRLYAAWRTYRRGTVPRTIAERGRLLRAYREVLAECVKEVKGA